VTDLL